MRTLAHLSDLHFGATEPGLVAALIDTVRALAPDVVAVSGDLTQRARRGEFAQARAFLAALPSPQIVVPGNHDVPLYNVVARFAAPLAGFRCYITAERYPCTRDADLLVIGADTTRSFTIEDGGLTRRDVEQLSRALAAAPDDVVKIVVGHHPFDPIAGQAALWTRPAPARDAIDMLIARGADVFLTGHRHVSFAGHTAVRYQTKERSAIVVEAGTATSTRHRGEPNAFNLLRIDGSSVVVERLEWRAAVERFVPAQRDEFVRDASGWKPVARA